LFKKSATEGERAVAAPAKFEPKIEIIAPGPIGD
jgi:hypothetical protein